MMFWYGGSWAWWQAALMWLIMIGFWGFVIWIVYHFVVSPIRGTRSEDRDDSARQILAERLARGAIDVEEYRRLRDELDQHRSVGTGATR